MGASNYPASRLAEALAASADHGWVRYESLQPHYNLVHRPEFEDELKDLCQHEGLGVIPYSPLAGGFLTGKYRRAQPLPKSGRADSVRRRYLEDAHAWQVLAAADDIGQSHDKTAGQVALAWLLSQPRITAPIIGANSRAQLQESLGSLDLELTPEELIQLHEASGRPPGPDN